MPKKAPEVYLVAASEMDFGILGDYLDHVDEGLKDRFTFSEVHGDPGSLCIIEAAGRLCYKSWEPGLNPNVEKVREGNDAYLKNIIKSGHGAVLEHASATFIFNNVSRVFTHELVRHRAGVAISQESLRYVRLEDYGMVIPDLPDDLSQAQKEQVEGISHLISDFIKSRVRSMFEAMDFYDEDVNLDFAVKKVLTSWVRRHLPIGVATSMMWTANMRTLRHVIALRTSAHAETEIRAVFQVVAEMCKEKWPSIFFDMEKQDDGSFVFEHNKI
tara:strand:+ start:208 stop:1023 length:816 start_codon:yes stop_codon:yes gene_type:complete